MDNEYTDIIKEKMKDFKQYEFTKEDENRDYCITKSNLNPYLLGYIFDKILKFNVEYRIFEKLNYIISFKYKNKIGMIEHSKLSFTIYLEESINVEVNNIFSEVITIFEKALLQYSEIAVQSNNYSLPNRNGYYVKKLNIIDGEINNFFKRIENINKTFEIRKENLINSGSAYKQIEKKHKNFTTLETPLSNLSSKYLKKIEELELKVSYLIELYIDNYFSYFEHLLCLLYPMTDEYDESKEYSEYLNYDWRTKLGKLNSNGDFTEIIEKMSEIKEIYRNRFAHGLFSREKLVNVMIPSFASYPLWIGKKYCKGFTGTSMILSVEEYNKCSEVFSHFIALLNEKYSLALNIINSGIPTFLKKNFYGDALLNKDENKYWIEKYWYHQDNLRNMDW